MNSKNITSKPKTELKIIFVPLGYKFLFAGLSSILATCFVQPLSLIKTRMQLNPTKISPLTATKGVLQREGVFSLYNGLSAGVLKSGTYTTLRLGLYYTFFDRYAELHHGRPPRFKTKLAFGVIAGTMAGFLVNPAEVALVRMTADGRQPENLRRNYKHVIHAFSRIIKEEGFHTLFRGGVPSIAKAAVFNAAQLSLYSQARVSFIKYINEGVLLHVCCAVISGFVAAAVSLPFDRFKTEAQNAIKRESYWSITKRIFNRSVFSLWSGFMPYCTFIILHTVLIFCILEQLNAAYFKHIFHKKQDTLADKAKRKKSIYEEIVRYLTQFERYKTSEDEDKEGENPKEDEDKEGENPKEDDSSTL